MNYLLIGLVIFCVALAVFLVRVFLADYEI
jgi:hypothetical protein